MILVDADETGVCAVEEETEGDEAKAFAGVSAIQARAGLIAFFERFFGDGLGRESMLWGLWGRLRRQRRQRRVGVQWMKR